MSWFDSVRKALRLGKGPTQQRLASTGPPGSYVQKATPAQRLWDMFAAIGAATPARVSSILSQANSGRPAEFVDLVHELREKDGHVHCVLQTRELGVSCLEWDVVPPEDSTPAEEEAAAQYKAALRKVEALSTLWEHLVGEGVLFGHATAELFWDFDETTGLLAPTHAEHISCRRFAFRQSDGALLFDPSASQVSGNVDQTGVDLLEDFPLGKFIQIRRRITGDVMVREGLGRILAWVATFRNWTLRDWLQLAEMAWKPMRIGKYTRDASTKDLADLTDLLEQLTASGVATHSKDIELMLEWPANSGQKTSEHKELASFLGAEFSKAVVGHALAADPAERGTKEQAAGANVVRNDIREADSIALAMAVRTFITQPFYDLNFGAGVRPAEFFFVTEDRTDLAKFSEAIERLIAAGLKIPASYVYDQTGIPEPADGDELVEAGAPAENDSERIHGKLHRNEDGSYDVVFT